MESETHFDDIPVDDVEKLRSELIDLAERGKINQTRVFLSNKRKCNEAVLRKIMADYAEKKQRLSEMLMSVAFVKLLPDLLEKSGCFRFKGGHASFSGKILADENTMFVIADLMPCCEGSGYYFKYFSATIFLGSLIYSDVSFAVGVDEESEQKSEPEVVPDPEPEQKSE